MDFATIVGILDQLMAGGPKAVMIILAIFVVGLFIERKRLLKEIENRDTKIDKIIDDYYKGNMTLAEALNSLKLVLYEIKEHFRG